MARCAWPGAPQIGNRAEISVDFEHHDGAAEGFDGGVVISFAIADDGDGFSILASNGVAEVGDIAFRELVLYLFDKIGRAHV